MIFPVELCVLFLGSGLAILSQVLVKGKLYHLPSTGFPFYL